MNLEGKMIANRYEVITQIGCGGMATVYKARDSVLNRNVAIKVLREEFTTDEEFIKRFNVEAQAAASLTHPNIVSIYDVGNEGDLYYIVMESTYGNRTHESLDTVYQELAYTINRTIERGGKVIIPSFAIERAQELIYFIKNLMHDNKIPRVPVYVDSPMAVNATGVFSIHSECFNNKIKDDFISKGKNPFSVKSLKYISSYQESLQIARSKKPCIVISAQGMCEAGRIINHIKHGIGNPNRLS